MQLPTYIRQIAVSFLLIMATGTVVAASNTNALLGASEPAVLELSDTSMSSQPRSILITTGSMAVAQPATTVAQRLSHQENRGFDWSTLISLSFGVAGLLWVRRRTADL